MGEGDGFPEITEVRVFPVPCDPRNRRHLANAEIVVGGMYAVRGLRLIGGESGPFVAMPALRWPNGTRRDAFYPIRREGSEAIDRAVLAEYERVTGLTREEHPI